MDRIRKVQVVVYTMIKEPQFLVLRRIPSKGSIWQNVTGAIEDGETLENAAYRELEEETGIGRDKILEFGQLFSFEYRDARDMEVEETVFFAKIKEGTPVDITKNVYPEHETFKWCSDREAIELMKWKTNSRAIEAVMENLKK
ncbi:NUDIX pyrophosphatase [Oxyplasma meridianum]|uniref:NUDIX pyrophosphatase n=1 Tax=Oxyplasma meridianum TaxID=3073602 RepID=A0AAX4NES6_9ARCH